jgi:hypothetical protein
MINPRSKKNTFIPIRMSSILPTVLSPIALATGEARMSEGGNNYTSDLSPGLSPIALATVEAKGEALAKGEAISMAGIATSRSPSSTLLAMTTVP